MLSLCQIPCTNWSIQQTIEKLPQTKSVLQLPGELPLAFPILCDFSQCDNNKNGNEGIHLVSGGQGGVGQV